MSAAEGFALLEWDWFYSEHSERLHHATLTAEQLQEWADNSQLEEETVTATCGRRIRWPSVPGMFSRMSMRRCDRCSDRVGYDRGIGSPKNDKVLRPLVQSRIDAGEAV